MSWLVIDTEAGTIAAHVDNLQAANEIADWQGWHRAASVQALPPINTLNPLYRNGDAI